MKALICIAGCHYLMNGLRALILWLCRITGDEIMPTGCRPIPKGHFNFDPIVARQHGVNQAILYQTIWAWIEYNREHDRNLIQGRHWSYNSADQWAAMLDLWHVKTVRKYLLELQAACLLDGVRFSPQKPKYYALNKDSGDGSQGLLWPELATPMGGANDSHNNKESSQHIFSINQPKPTPKTARARRPLNGGGVADFPTPSEKRELPEKRLQAPELREAADEGDASMPTVAIEETVSTADATTPTPISAVPPPVSAEISLIFHASMPDELAQIGESRLRHELKYVERFNETATDKTRIANPAGYAISQCRKYPDRPTPLKKTRQEIQDEEWEAYKLTEDYRLNYRPYEPPGAPPNPEPPDHTGDTTEPDNVAEGLVLA